jgi:ribosomal-protein-serine acetyltransferase
MFRVQLRPDLEMRLIEERHAGPVFALVNQDREDLRQWLPWVDSNRAESDTLTFIRGALERFASKTEVTAGLWLGGAFTGVIGTHKLDWLNRKAEIGYWLGRAFRGQGIMTEACRATIRYCLRELDLHRVEIHCAVGNVKSKAIPARLGLVHEATLREAELLHGKYHDLELWSMLQPDFRD